ncbi:hypothetical protein PO002_05080 [Cupriavidus necator]|uniref:hypothetical protein n=1 Tax=Cupriavidus necator TaxID=106590 RepID=UPI0039C23FD5
MEIRFRPDMSCCKSTRESLGFSCVRPYQLCCAWHHACRLAPDKGMRGLRAFAQHLLGFWPLCDVFLIFAAAGQMSALAEICCERWVRMPDATARAAYRSEVAAATQVYRVECGPDSSGAFLSTFDVLCEAAAVRP